MLASNFYESIFIDIKKIIKTNRTESRIVVTKDFNFGEIEKCWPKGTSLQS